MKLINKISIILLLIIPLVSCHSYYKVSTLYEKIDLAQWNSMTINLLISSFRIDTTSYNFPPAPPIDIDYSEIGQIDNNNKYNIILVDGNDIATTWSFLNRRSLLLPILNQLKIQGLPTLEIIEFYERYKANTEYEVSDGANSYKIIISYNGDYKVEKIDELSNILEGYMNNRCCYNNLSIRTVVIKTVINLAKNKTEYSFKTLYISDD